MKMNLSRKMNCRICDSDKLNKVIDFGMSAISDDYFKDRDNTGRYPLACCLCSNCGLLQLDHVVDPSDIYDDYIYWSTSSPGLDHHFKAYSESVFQLLGLHKDSLVLDIGCNDGMLLRHFKRLGCRVAGVEPSKQIAEYANKYNLNVLNSYWNAEAAAGIQENHKSVDVVTCNNVFANVDDIQSFGKHIASVLGPDGVFIIEAGYHLSMIENFVFDNIYHEHLSYFSVSALQKFFASLGMHVFHVEEVETKGGSIRLFVSFNDSHHRVQPSVAAAMKNEERAELFNPETYERYTEKLVKLKTDVRDVLEQLKKEGKTIIGFGASATVTTVLHVLDIGGYFSFLVDDNPIKHNTLSPGYQIPVRETREMYLDEPCCVVILPWRFADMFIDKHRKFQNHERSFLKIIPNIYHIVG
jgi:SAM-dependent methyltransferase